MSDHLHSFKCGHDRIIGSLSQRCFLSGFSASEAYDGDSRVLFAVMNELNHKEKEDFFSSLFSGLSKKNLSPCFLNIEDFCFQECASLDFHDQFLSSSEKFSQLHLQAAALISIKYEIPFDRALFFAVDFEQKISHGIKQIQPKLMVLWNQFTWPALLIREICSQLSIRVIFLEYGYLPGSIVLNESGQMADSEIVKLGDYQKKTLSSSDSKRALNYLNYAKELQLDRKGDDNVALVREEFDFQDGLTNLYLGQNDLVSGLVPDWTPMRKRHSPFFTSSIEALLTLDELCQDKQLNLVFRPHPLTRDEDLKKCQDSFIEPSFVVDKVPDLYRSIKKVDLVTTILSTGAYISLLLNKPTILLGRNSLTSSQCVYELSSLEDLESVYEKALHYGFTDEMKKYWIDHAAVLLKHYLYPVNKEFDHLFTLKTSDLASRIQSYLK